VSRKREAGYREPADRDAEEPAADPAAGQLLVPTADEAAALGRLRTRERSSVVGIVVMAAILIRYVAPLGQGIAYLPAVAVLGGLALLGYALVRYNAPPGIGPFLLRRSPGGDVVAGLRFRVTLLLQPWRPLPLSPLRLRFVAWRGEEGHEEVAYETDHCLLEDGLVGAGEAVRVETTLRLPEDAPPTASDPRVRWRLEVSAGSPPRLLRTAAVKVRAGTRRRRKA
jgi:hypothetical protein